jgi:hypothetical protein
LRRRASALPKRAHVATRRLSDVNTYGKALLTPDEIDIIESANSDLWHEVQAACLKIQSKDPVLKNSYKGSAVG